MVKDRDGEGRVRREREDTVGARRHIVTSCGGRMSRASVSHSGRLENPKVVDLSLDLTVFEPWSSQTNDFKMCRSLAWRSALLG